MTRLTTLTDLDATPESWDDLQKGAVSIGNYDGVHVGHRHLLAGLKEMADDVNGPAVVIVFDPHPSAILRRHSAPPRLTSVERRAELMSTLGIDHLIVCQTTIEFLNRTAEEFFRYLMVDRLQPRAMVEGPNFFFGRDRGGDIHQLERLCEGQGIRLWIAPPQVDGTRMVSSSRIREALASGDIMAANAMLGSGYRVRGIVLEGERRGRTLGFPTANLSQLDAMPPGPGVYAALATLADGSLHQAAVHVGPNPTFDDCITTKIEVHCLDYDADLYNQSLQVDWVAKVRDIVKFAGPEELKSQLNRDLTTVRQILSTQPFRPS